MKHLKLFEGYYDLPSMTRTELSKLQSLDGFDFSMKYDYIVGNRESLSMENISIKKTDYGEYKLHIYRHPGYFNFSKSHGVPGFEEEWSKAEFDVHHEFETFDDLIKFLSEYEWYDLKR
jgi:hypothetical protein